MTKEEAFEKYLENTGIGNMEIKNAREDFYAGWEAYEKENNQ